MKEVLLPGSTRENTKGECALRLSQIRIKGEFEYADSLFFTLFTNDSKELVLSGSSKSVPCTNPRGLSLPLLM